MLPTAYPGAVGILLKIVYAKALFFRVSRPGPYSDMSLVEFEKVRHPAAFPYFLVRVIQGVPHLCVGDVPFFLASPVRIRRDFVDDIGPVDLVTRPLEDRKERGNDFQRGLGEDYRFPVGGELFERAVPTEIRRVPRRCRLLSDGFRFLGEDLWEFVFELGIGREGSVFPTIP